MFWASKEDFEQLRFDLTYGYGKLGEQIEILNNKIDRAIEGLQTEWRFCDADAEREDGSWPMLTLAEILQTHTSRIRDIKKKQADDVDALKKEHLELVDKHNLLCAAHKKISDMVDDRIKRDAEIEAGFKYQCEKEYTKINEFVTSSDKSIKSWFERVEDILNKKLDDYKKKSNQSHNDVERSLSNLEHYVSVNESKINQIAKLVEGHEKKHDNEQAEVHAIKKEIEELKKNLKCTEISKHAKPTLNELLDYIAANSSSNLVSRINHALRFVYEKTSDLEKGSDFEIDYLLSLTEFQLLVVPNFGRKCLGRLKEALNFYGIKLAEPKGGDEIRNFWLKLTEVKK